MGALIRPPCVVFFRMYGGVVFHRFQMREDFCRHAELLGQALFQQSCQSMRIADGHCVREEQVYLDDLPIPRSTVANTVILQTQLATNGIQLATYLFSNARVRVVEQSYRRAP